MEEIPAGVSLQTPEEFAASILLEGAQLVDVRTSTEFEAGHIEGAVNINFQASRFLEQVEAQLDKDRPVLLYCRSGRRSASAAEKMESAGFKQLVDLQGGFIAWEAQ